MIKITQIETLKDLDKVMPLFLEGYHAMNKRYRAFDCDVAGFIKTLVGILGSQPDNGILVAYSDDVPVGYGAAMEDTPPYCDKRQLLLWALYAQPAYSKLVSKALFDEAAVMAKRQGYSSLSCFNGRLTGSSFSFFERVLGMRRRRMEFQKIL